MTLLNKKIFETVMNIKNFDLLQYNKLLSEFKKEDIFDTFISLYYNSSTEEQKNLLKAYYPIFISFELEKIEINNDSCFLIIDKYGTKNVTKYFNELLSISDNKEEIRKKYAFFYNIAEEEKEMIMEENDLETIESIKGNVPAYIKSSHLDSDSFRQYLNEISQYPLITVEEEKKYFSLLCNLRNKLEIVSFDKDYVLSLNDMRRVINSINDYQTRRKVEKLSKYLCLDNKKIINGYIVLWKKINGNRKTDVIIPDKSSVEKLFDIKLGNDKYTADYFNEQLDTVILYCQTRELLYHSNLRLVVSMAKKFKPFNFSIEDRVTEGNIGLMKAVERFDPNMGYKFSTYSTWWIRQAISRAIADQANMVRIPVHMTELIRKIKNAQEFIATSKGRDATDEEIAEKLNMPVERIKYALRSAIEPSSLETPVNEEEDSTLGDFVADENSLTPEQNIFNIELKRCIQEALQYVSDRERKVIELRYALNGGKALTLEEVGNILGVTRERVRQIEAKALRKLKAPSRAKILKDFIN